jgi:hypothetical protein
MTDERENSNKITYKEFEAEPVGELTFDASEIPFATSPFCDEPSPPEIARDQKVIHTTVGGRGIVGRIK